MSSTPSPLHRLSALGQSVWIDSLSRDWIRGGHLQQLIDEDEVVGATSNPTIFQKAMSSGDAYDEQLRTLKGAPQGGAGERACQERRRSGLLDARGTGHPRGVRRVPPHVG